VETLPVVEDLDVIEEAPVSILPCLVALEEHALGLECVEE
jgi:hypothetical protein